MLTRGGPCRGSPLAEEVVLARPADRRRAGAVLLGDPAAEAADHHRRHRGGLVADEVGGARPPRRRSRSGSPSARGRWRRVRPRQSSIGTSPAQPIATSAWPIRQARPKLSAITTPIRAPWTPPISVRSRRAEASGSSGSSSTDSGSPTFELSIPALAQTSRGRSRRSARRVRRAPPRRSPRGSAARASAPCRAPPRSLRASAPGMTLERRRSRPSALETTFCETTTTSPSASSPARSAISSPSGSPSAISGIPSTGRTRTSPAPPARGAPSPRPPHIPSAFAVRLAPPPLLHPHRQRDDVGGGVEVQSQRRQLLDPVGDPGRPRRRDVALAAALAEARLDRARAAPARARWCRPRGGPGSPRRRGRGRRSASCPARAGRAAGSPRAGAPRRPRPPPRPPRSRPAPRRRGPSRRSRVTSSAPAAAASSAARGSWLTTIVRSIIRAAPIASSTSATIAATSSGLRSASIPGGEPRLRHREALHRHHRGRPHGSIRDSA